MVDSFVGIYKIDTEEEPVNLTTLEGYMFGRITFILLVIVGVAAAPANATSDLPIMVSFHGGMTVLGHPSELTDYWKKGYNLGGGIGFPVNTRVAMQVFFDFNDFGPHDFSRFLSAALPPETYQRLLEIWTLGVNVKMNTNEPKAGFSPYILTGLSMLHVADFKSDRDRAHVGASLNMGLGVDYVVSKRIVPYIQGQLQFGLYGRKGLFGADYVESASFIPIEIGVAFGL